MPDSAHRIAAGIASGAAISFTPLLGFHIVLAVMLAWLTRGNLLASIMGTIVGNPWTFPLIFSISGQAGALILPERAAAEVTAGVPEELADARFTSFTADPLGFLSELFDLLFPFFIGSLPVAFVVWLAVYTVTRAAIVGFRRARAARLKMLLLAKQEKEG